MCVTVRTYAEKRLNSLILRLVQKMQRSGDWWLVSNTGYWPASLLVRQCNNILCVRRPRGLFTSGNDRIPSGKDSLYAAPRPISFYVHAVWNKKYLGGFQHAMNVLLAKVRGLFALVYLEDLKILLQTRDKHINHVWWALTQLKDACLTLNLKKCKIFPNIIDYLGRVIRSGHREVSQWTIDPIRGLKHKQLDGNSIIFVLCNVLRLLVPNSALVAALFNKKLRKGQTQTFDKLCNDEITP